MRKVYFFSKSSLETGAQQEVVDAGSKMCKLGNIHLWRVFFGEPSAKHFSPCVFSIYIFCWSCVTLRIFLESTKDLASMVPSGICLLNWSRPCNMFSPEKVSRKIILVHSFPPKILEKLETFTTKLIKFKK